LLKYVKIRQF
jgi:hypothetical protein